jgi:hypothetical protein
MEQTQQHQPLRYAEPTGGSGNGNGDSYAPAVPSLDVKITRIYFVELSCYLTRHLAQSTCGVRGVRGSMYWCDAAAPADWWSTIQQKLMQLTEQRFQEFLTDVYDKLIQRKESSSENEGPSFITLLLLIYTQKPSSRSTLPAPLQQIPPKAESSAPEARHIAYYTLSGSLWWCALWTCKAISWCPRGALIIPCNANDLLLHATIRSMTNAHS